MKIPPLEQIEAFMPELKKRTAELKAKRAQKELIQLLNDSPFDDYLPEIEELEL